MLNMHKNGATSDYRATFRRFPMASDYLSTTDYPATMARNHQRLSRDYLATMAQECQRLSRDYGAASDYRLCGGPRGHGVPLHGRKEKPPLGEGGRRKAGAAWEPMGERQAGSARSKARAFSRFALRASKFARFPPFELLACPDIGKNKGPL